MITILLVIVIVMALDIVLYPCTFMRNDVHAIVTEKNDVLILGTSTGKMNIDPEVLLAGTGLSGHNICVGGEYPMDSYYLLSLAIEKQKPKEIIYVIDPEYFTMKKEVGNNFLLFYHEFPASVSKLRYFIASLKDADIRNPWFAFYEYPRSTEWPRIGDNLRQKLTGTYELSTFQGEVQKYHENGWIEEYPVKEEDFAKMSRKHFSEEDVTDENMHYMDAIVKLCKEQGIRFTAVSTPLPQASLAAFSDDWNRAWDYFSGYCNKQGIPYLNFNREYYKAFSHETDVFVDYAGHLSGDGAQEFSSLLNRLLYQ